MRKRPGGRDDEQGDDEPGDNAPGDGRYGRCCWAQDCGGGNSGGHCGSIFGCQQDPLLHQQRQIA